MRYIGFDIVDAEPMKLGDYCKFQGLEIPEKKCLKKDGYIIYHRKGKPYEYVTWRPKAEFDDEWCELHGMTFGMALEAMRCGCRAARMDWNGKDMWLSIPLAEERKRIKRRKLGGRKNEACAQRRGGKVKESPYITMKAANGWTAVGWVPTQADMLAEDWYVIAETDGTKEAK